MTSELPDIGKDHCRVVPPTEGASIEERAAFLRHLFAYVECTKYIPYGARVLEVGAGAGYGASYLADAFPGIVATDMSDDALTYARRRYPRVDFRRAAATELPFAENSFDAVISFQVMEHVPDDTAYLTGIQRVIRPGGRLILSTPNRRWRLYPFQVPANRYHIREYSARGLKRLLVRHFADVQLWGVQVRPDLMAMMARRPNLLLAYGSTLKYHAMQFLPAKWKMRINEQHAGAPDSSAGHVTSPVDVTTEEVCLREVGLDDFQLSPDAVQGVDLFAVATAAGSWAPEITPWN